MVECQLPKLNVAGSNPVARSKKSNFHLELILKSKIFGTRFFEIIVKKSRALSSVGSEHLPYKQRVGGSTPSAPTILL